MNNIKSSRIVRISSELDRQIKDLMEKNNMRYVDASRDIAKFAEKLHGKQLFKEIRF